ncbi:MAG: hypothetical protein NVSMB1_19830 [Polyangiales bacterium]
MIGVFVLVAVVSALLGAAILLTPSPKRRYARAFRYVFRKGNGKRALAVLDAMPSVGRWVFPSACLRLYALRLELRVDEAADAALALAAHVATGRLLWHMVNGLVDTLVCAGRYQEALAIEQQLPQDAIEKAIRAKDPSLPLLHINFAEAEMNLGRDEAALARLDRWNEAASCGSLTANGLTLQRAWILGVMGKGVEAVAATQGAQRQPLGLMFAAEFHLSRAFAFLAENRIGEASKEIEDALVHAMRPSSVRNALFMKARIADLGGDWELADRYCAEAAAHPHRWQGGDGLLFWGDLLLRRGKREGARRAWSLAIERDPQSSSASVARSRLLETLAEQEC